jgi:hypothetical protein
MAASFILDAQSFKATYTYDSNGNRVSATVIYLLLKSAKLDTAEIEPVEIDSVKLELDQKLSKASQLDSLPNYNVHIFPNPTQGDLLVEIDGVSPTEFTGQGNVIKILNLNGQLMLDINPVPSYNTVDLSQLAGGTYILLLYINGKAKTYKIIKN